MLLKAGVMVLNVTSRFPSPVLHVRLGECCEDESWRGRGGMGCAECSWSTPESVVQVGGRRLGAREWQSEFAVATNVTAAEVQAWVRVEYASEAEALRPLDAASDRPSFVGAKIRGAWPVVMRQPKVPDAPARSCTSGESFAGPGRWRRSRALSEKSSEAWTWQPAACAPVTPSRHDVHTCVRDGLQTVGDSLLRQVAETLQRDWDDGILHHHVRGPMPLRLDDLLRVVDELVQNKTKGTVVFNGAGLWQAAYGDINGYAAGLDRLLQRAAALPRLVLAHTTAVHPVHFLRDFDALHDAPRLIESGQKRHRTLAPRRFTAAPRAHPTANLTLQARVKRAMTLPRVRAQFDVETHLADRYQRPVLDLFHPTIVREDDPLEPSDIRHFGASTVDELARLLLAAVCQPGPARAPSHDSAHGGSTGRRKRRRHQRRVAAGSRTIVT